MAKSARAGGRPAAARRGRGDRGGHRGRPLAFHFTGAFVSLVGTLASPGRTSEELPAGRDSLDDVTSRLYSAVLSDVLDSVGCTGPGCRAGAAPAQPRHADGRLRAHRRAVSISHVPEQPYAKLLEAIDGMMAATCSVHRPAAVCAEARSSAACWRPRSTSPAPVASSSIDYARDAVEIQKNRPADLRQGPDAARLGRPGRGRRGRRVSSRSAACSSTWAT